MNGWLFLGLTTLLSVALFLIGRGMLINADRADAAAGGFNFRPRTETHSGRYAGYVAVLVAPILLLFFVLMSFGVIPAHGIIPITF